MKRYHALIKVNATPMTRQAYNDLRGWELPADEDGSDEGYLTEDINGQSNLDCYSGYVSWTPKAMFEDQFYEQINPTDVSGDTTQVAGVNLADKFDFGLAIHALKAGKKVQRAGWNGKGMFLYYVPAASYPMQRNSLETMGGVFPDDMVPYGAYIAMKTAQDNVVPWLASQTDVLAEDWQLA
jgi:hypothetical protein